MDILKIVLMIIFVMIVDDEDQDLERLESNLFRRRPFYGRD